MEESRGVEEDRWRRVGDGGRQMDESRWVEEDR
jgi:hypothetical protein